MTGGALFLWASEWQPAPRATPAGRTLFAIGDLHGCAAQLAALQRVIRERVRATGRQATLVYVGDYVDRGPCSSSVLDLVQRGLGEPAVHEVALAGNHDVVLRALLAEQEPSPDLVAGWLSMSAAATLIDLGLDESIVTESPRRFRVRLAAALGGRRLAFLRGLALAHREGGYLFVHAGIDPRGSRREHDLATLLEMREPFLSWKGPWPHPFTVVHGHTPMQPMALPHRVGVDTGAPFTGALTAVEIEGEHLRFLTVAGGDESWRDPLPGDRGATRYTPPRRLPGAPPDSPGPAGPAPAP